MMNLTIKVLSANPLTPKQKTVLAIKYLSFETLNERYLIDVKRYPDQVHGMFLTSITDPADDYSVETLYAIPEDSDITVGYITEFLSILSDTLTDRQNAAKNITRLAVLLINLDMLDELDGESDLVDEIADISSVISELVNEFNHGG